jgi:MFS family permease
MRTEPGPPDAAPTPARPRSGWRRVAGVLAGSPGLARFLAGRLAATHGTWVFRLAVGWAVWEMTRSPLMVSLAVALQLGPQVLLAPVAGVWADRLDERRLLLHTHLASGLGKAGIAALALAGALSLPLLLGGVALVAIVGALSQASAKTLVGALVADDDLATAISLNSVVFNVATFVGPAVAGAVIAAAGIGWAFALAAALTLLFALLLRWLPGTAPAAADAASVQAEPPAPAGLFTDIVAGLRHAAADPVLRALLALHAASATLARPFLEFVPALVNTLFGGGAQRAAWVLSAVGLGSVCGGLWLAQRDPARGQLPVVLGAMLGLGLVLIGFAWAPHYALALVLAFAAGFGMLTRAAAIQTLIQSHTRRGMRGRAMALYGLLLHGGAIVGALLIGLLAAPLGLRGALTTSVALALLAWAALRWPLTAALAAHAAPAAHAPEPPANGGDGHAR